MKPTLFTLFGVDVPAYFGMLAIGFILATWVGARWLGRLGYDREVVIDLGLASVIAGVIGSRLLHVVADGYFWDYVHLCTDPSKVDWHISQVHCTSRAVDGIWDATRGVCHPKQANCFAWAAFWAGGLTYYGGLIGATGYAVYFLRRERFPFWKAADMAGFAIALGLAWGRMGCFLAGCCFGSVCHYPFAAYFPGWSPASEAQFRAHLLAHEAHPALPVHPTQLYESAGSLLIAAVTYLVIAPRKRYDGQMFVFFLAAYSVLRSVLEVWRRDDRGGFLGLSTSQLISVGIVLALIPLSKWLRARSGSAAIPRR
ncbi:MAG: prolipoprotein diacylglyceryl transferase [Polyangiales bacterium]